MLIFRLYFHHEGVEYQKLERNSRKVSEMELETPPCPCRPCRGFAAQKKS